MTNRVNYRIGFYTRDGIFKILNNKKRFRNFFPTREMAEEKRKELQGNYKHRLEIQSFNYSI
jgi:hypothetical protein